jgi:hypothetical protein
MSNYSNYELIVVHDGAIPDDLASELGAYGVCAIAAGEPFNRAAASNLGAARAAGSHLLFLQEDVEIVTENWLETLLQQSLRPEIGVAAASSREAASPGEGVSDPPPATGCFITRRAVFDAVSGFTEELGFCYADLDYHLKVLRLGKGVVTAPGASIRHPRSRLGAYPAELQLFQARWPEHAWDPFHNPNLGEVYCDHG